MYDNYDDGWTPVVACVFYVVCTLKIVGRRKDVIKEEIDDQSCSIERVIKCSIERVIK